MIDSSPEMMALVGSPIARSWLRRKKAIFLRGWSVSILVYIEIALNMKSLACGGSFGRRSKHCFSSKELAMNDGSFWTSGWSRLELVVEPLAEGVKKAAAD
jgi:hypothetical protein